MKLVAWALLRPLLEILEKDTVIPAPGENPLQAKQGSPEKYVLAITSMASQVDQYCKHEMTDNTSVYVSSRVIVPFLEEYHRHFHEYGTKLPVLPNYGMLQMDSMVGKSIYHLQALASGVYEFFYPSCFTYNNVPIQILAEMGHAALKTILSKLFALDGRKSLENKSLFEKIAADANLLKQLRCSDLVEDRNRGQDFLEISSISNMIMDILRNAAINSLHYFALIFPSLVTNPLYKSQVEGLHYMSTAF
jgi:hypothetical protein